MNVFVARQFPIPCRDLKSIASVLRERSALCGVINLSANWYDPMWYAEEQGLHAMTFTLLLDRNIYSLAVGLADGDDAEYTDSHRAAAAVLCFAHCCGLRTDYSIAVLEHELDSGDPRFSHELAKFRRVWASGAKSLATFALGGSACLTLAPGSPDLPAELPELSEVHRPDAWQLDYGCALKIASLMLDSGFADDTDRMVAYLRWCHDEFFFSAGPTVYGSLALSPRRKPRMFKNLRGTDGERAMRGIRNAAWDMTLISEWEERQAKLSTTKNHHLICSFDEAITDVASAVMSQGLDEAQRLGRLRDRFISEWGDDGGSKLFGTYEPMLRSADQDPKRPANQKKPRAYWNEKVARLETTVENLIPGCHRS